MFDLERKVIFIHPPKTGGTTIEAAFGWHPNYHPKDSRKEYTVHFKNFKHASLAEHIDAIERRGLDSREFYKFACIRNPWDVMVSRFFHDRSFVMEKENKKAEELPLELKYFNIFVLTRLQDMKKDWLNVEKYFFYKGKYAIDYIIRYEHYKKDTEKIFSKYGVDWPESSYNANTRPAGYCYRSLYTESRTIKAVEKTAKDFIDLFNYKFY